MLCDHVAVADGKLYINGGGWNITGPDAAPSGIAVLIEVPWNKTNRQIPLRIRLLHEDGDAVTQASPAGSAPVEVGAEVEVGRPAGLPPGSPLLVPLAVNLPPIPLPAGHGYVWQAELDGESDADWRLPFRTREAPQAARPGPTDPTALPGLGDL